MFTAARSYLLTLPNFGDAKSSLRSSFRSLKEAVESLLRHGVQPLCAFEVTKKLHEQLDELPALVDEVPQVLWLMFLELSQRTHVQRTADVAAFQAVKQALEGRGVPLGVILAIDWLEGVEFLEQKAAQRLMRRQLEALETFKVLETVLLLPRRAGHVHFHGKEVRISRLSVTLETHWKLLSWFQGRYHNVELIASQDVLEHELLQAVEEHQALWINEQILRSLNQRRLELDVGLLSTMDAWSFLVTLCCMESWPKRVPVASSSFRNACEAMLLAKARHERPERPGLVGRKWDQSLQAVVKSRKELSRALAAELAAELFLRWRRKTRQESSGSGWTEGPRLHVLTAEACLQALLQKEMRPEEAVKAVKAAKEASARSLPPLLLKEKKEKSDVTREVEAAAVAALLYLQGQKRAAFFLFQCISALKLRHAISLSFQKKELRQSSLA